MSRYMASVCCRFHPSAVLIEDYRAGDMICPECGLVVAERVIDVSETWPTSSDSADNKDRCRVGAAENLLYHFTDLETTTIAPKKKVLSNDTKHSQVQDMTIRTTSNEKVLQKAHHAIRNAAVGMGITKKVIDRALLVFKECHEKKCMHGFKENVITGCSIYIACRQENSARTINEIIEHLKLENKEFQRCFLKMKQSLQNPSLVHAIDAKDLVSRFCSQLKLNEPLLIRKTAINIIESVNNIGILQGRAPTSIVSASIYLACLVACEDITKKDIQKVTNAAESTIGVIYKLMLKHVSELFPSDFVFKRPINELPKV